MRKAEVNRSTRETNITVKLNIDGTGETTLSTGIGFLNHMLELFAFWGHFDLGVFVKKNDFNIDIHHTNEDVGIVLGQVFKEALGDKKGINRIGSASVPMEAVTANVTVDISGRYTFAGLNFATAGTEKDYSLSDASHFLDSFAKQLGMNLNIKVEPTSPDLHTTLEPIFKALGIAMDQATQIDPRRKSVPSTKGVID